MSTCLSSRVGCGFNLEQMIKWPSCISRTTSNSSSPSSTLSESTNSPIAISTRKPRKPRKRPNQTYNEAAALLSLACPNVFTSKHLTKTTSLSKFTKHNHGFFNELPELIENQERITEKPFSLIESKGAKLCQKAGEVELNGVCVELSDGCVDDFDTESILDEEIEQGIDSIMGDSNSIQENVGYDLKNTCYGYPIGLGFGVRNGVRALRNDNERNWRCSRMVDVVNISQAVIQADCEKLVLGKKNKNKKKKKKVEDLMKTESEFGHLSTRNGHRLMLKLDYDGVMNAWTDKRLPLPEEISSSMSTGGDIHAKAANIDLFSKNGGWSSESSVTRSMEQNHIKKIRTHHASSDRRPRSCKGRFVKKPSSIVCYEET